MPKIDIKTNQPRNVLPLLTLLFLAGCAGGGGSPAPSGVAYTGSLFDSTPLVTCNGHLMAGDAAASDQELCRDGYAVGYNYTKKEPNWVAYHITASSVSASVTRVDHFREDPEIPSISRSTLSDYSGSGYDRGHMAPNATMDFSQKSMDESFLLSNISPQRAGFNRNAWADLEQYVRDCAVAKGELYVVTGPIFNPQSTTVIGSGVAVPDGFYKVIIKPGSPASGFAFKIPHQDMDKSELENYVTSIDTVEAATGLNFFSAIRDDIENPIERNTKPICALPWAAPVVSGSGSGGSGGSSGAFGACGTKTTCGQMTSCSEAYYFLNTCGRSSLDGDGDGVPCESLCK